MGKGRNLVFEPDTTQEQRQKVIGHYLKEKHDALIMAKEDPIFIEFKNFFRIYWQDIMKDPSNAHLRREVLKPQ